MTDALSPRPEGEPTGAWECHSEMPKGHVVVGEHVWAHPPVCLSVCLRTERKPGSPVRSGPGQVGSRPPGSRRCPRDRESAPCSLPSWKTASHAALVCSLLVAERPAPPRELLVPQAQVTARSLQLRWVPGSDGASPIRYFTVQLRELPRGEWQTYSSSVSHEATACAVERYPEPGGPSPGDAAGQLTSLLRVHTPCTRDRDPPCRSPLQPLPRLCPSGPALCRWHAHPRAQGWTRHR